MLIWCGIGAAVGQNCVCHMVLGLPSKAFVPTPLPQMVSWLSTESSDQSFCASKLRLTVNVVCTLPLKVAVMVTLAAVVATLVVTAKVALFCPAGTVTFA